jgi:hypothetical protein
MSDALRVACCMKEGVICNTWTAGAEGFQNPVHFWKKGYSEVIQDANTSVCFEGFFSKLDL